MIDNITLIDYIGPLAIGIGLYGIYRIFAGWFDSSDRSRRTRNKMNKSYYIEWESRNE